MKYNTGHPLACAMVVMCLLFSGTGGDVGAQLPFAQAPDEDAQASEALEEDAQTQASIYQIREIVYNIEGNTQPFALQERLERFYVGIQYETREQFEAAVAEQRRILENLRQIEGVTIEYTLERGDALIFVDVRIGVTDSGSFIALPKPGYSTDEGGVVGLRIVEYNFLGTLEELTIAADWIIPNDGNHRLLLRPSVLLPFEAAGTTWHWQSTLSAEFPLGDHIADLQAVFDNTIGVDFLIFNYKWTLAYTQGISFSLDPQDDLYLLRSALAFRSDLETIALNEFLGPLRYRPEISAQVQYRFEQVVREDDRGFDVAYKHRLGFERIDWIGNLREGIRIWLDNTNTFNTFTLQIDSDIGVEVSGHLEEGILGFSGRLGARYYFPLSDSDFNLEDGGKFVRGVIDSDVATGNVIAYANVDLRLADFTNRDSLEAQGGLFVDTLIATDTSRPFDARNDLRLGVGFEGLGFLLQSRSIVVRLTAGFDLLRAIYNQEAGKDIFDDGNLEIFFGFGNFY